MTDRNDTEPQWLSMLGDALLPATDACPPEEELLRIGAGTSDAAALRSRHAAHIAACRRCRALTAMPNTSGPFRGVSNAEAAAVVDEIIAGLARPPEPRTQARLVLVPRRTQPLSALALAAMPEGAPKPQLLRFTEGMLPVQLRVTTTAGALPHAHLALKSVETGEVIPLTSDKTARVLFEGPAGVYEMQMDGYDDSRLEWE